MPIRSERGDTSLDAAGEIGFGSLEPAVRHWSLSTVDISHSKTPSSISVKTVDRLHHDCLIAIDPRVQFLAVVGLLRTLFRGLHECAISAPIRVLAIDRNRNAERRNHPQD